MAVLVSRQADASWTKLHPVPGNDPITASWFFDPMNGFIGYQIQSVTPVLRTSDGGQNWRAVTFKPALTVGKTHRVTDIWFRDSLTGWMTMDWQHDLTDGVLWHSTDGGATWVQITTVTSMQSPGCVWQTPAETIVTESNGLGIWRSTDSGATWTTQGTRLNGLGFINSLVGACTADQNHYFLYTADGGINWTQPSVPNNFLHEAWSVYPWRKGGMFIAVPEDSIPGGGSFVYRTKPFYPGLWTRGATKLPFRTTGHIAGVDNLIYIQNSGTIPGADSGLYRSLDTGNTWKSVGGPNEDCDTRFSVTGCGDVVYAFDNYGNIYKTIDGGDGYQIPQCVFIDKDTLRPMVSAICDSTRNTYWLHNTNYGAIFIQDLRIIDTVRTPWKTSAVFFDSIPTPYWVINPKDSVSLDLGWRPIRMMDSTASDSAILRVIYFTTYLNRFDTVFLPVKLRAFSNSAQYSLSTSAVRADSISPCYAYDTVLSITNLGCDTLRLTKAQLSILSAWSITDTSGKQLTLPAIIAPNTSFRFRLGALPNGLKSISDSLQLKMHFQGRDTNEKIRLELSGRYTSPLTSLLPMQFDSLATCVSMDSTVSITNSGCDKLDITQVDLNGADWSLLDTNGQSIAFPISVLPGTHNVFKIRFAPKVIGQKHGTLTLHIKYLDSASTVTMQLDGTGVDAGSFSYARAFDFGAVSVCSYYDTTVIFRNTSCSAITLQSLQIGNGFTLLDAGMLPATVAEGSGLALHIRFKPSDKSVKSGQAIIRYLMDGTYIDDTIALVGTGTSGTSTLESKSPLTAQSFTPRTECDHTDSVSFVLFNSGCDTTRVTALSFDGTLAPTFRATANKLLPATIIGTDSLRITLGIAQLVEGSYSGNLHIQFILSDRSVHDSLVPVTLTVSRGPRSMKMETTAIAFGTISACTPRDTVIVYSDTGCAAITIFARDIAGTGFTLSKQGIDPIVLKPGESDTLHVHYDGSVSGPIQATVTVSSNSDVNPIRTVTVSATSLPSESINFVLKVSKTPVLAGEQLIVGLYPDRNVSIAAITSLSGVLDYYDDAFESIVAPSSMAGTTLAWNSVRIGRHNRSSFQVSNARGFQFDTTIPVLSIPLVAVVADSVGGDIFVDSLRMSGATPNAADCVESNMLASVQTGLTIQCNDSLLIGTLRNEPLLLIAPPKPNPVTAQTGFTADLDLRAACDGRAEISVSDALGRSVSKQSIAIAGRNPAELTLNLNAFPAGTYYYAITFTSANGAFRKMGSLVLMR
ncbi:MAG: choice-of-anchor D domain-containing protein [Bacteroidota bacterium]|nr:choice-of-anchor D domain-containing protein [Bacteroidota bacterium]MDP4233533.1 choice-of-anchor D domain-containing protein [Bacteroidota bacterium]MDP4244042.1 choice-of-anchor D domain-containing protein [Bacteroidota bacterium]MDP4287719.1 choice-of-anchor D domain-containing protein [Bacteroidota bacterium]